MFGWTGIYKDNTNAHVQFEEGIGDLEHENVRVTVFVTDEDTLARPPHSMLFIVLLKAL